jgi:hypothetical protein
MGLTPKILSCVNHPFREPTATFKLVQGVNNLGRARVGICSSRFHGMQDRLADLAKVPIGDPNGIQTRVTAVKGR